MEKFRNSLNYSELITAIERETNVGKSEANYVRNCAASGKIIMLQSVLDLPSIPSEVVLRIVKSLCEILITNKLMEETILFVFKVFFEKLVNDFYHDCNFNSAKNSSAAQKNFSKLLQNIFEILEKYISNNKSQIEQSQKIYEYCLYFLIARLYLKAKHSKNSNNTKEKIIMGLIENHFGTGFINTILDDGTILGFFKLIVKNSTFAENENLKNKKNNNTDNVEKSLNISLDLFFEILKLNKEKEKIYKIWNLINDENTNKILTEISPKNFQNLIYSVSKFVLKNCFHLEYVKQIFDNTFLLGFVKFRLKQKFKYLTEIIEVVSENIEKLQESKNINEETSKNISQYALDLLNVFGNNPQTHISIQTFKGFHAVYFY